jgi:hypothetical protein
MRNQLADTSDIVRLLHSDLAPPTTYLTRWAERGKTQNLLTSFGRPIISTKLTHVSTERTTCIMDISLHELYKRALSDVNCLQ